FLLEAFLERLHLFFTLVAPPHLIHRVVARIFRRSGMGAVVFLRPRFHPLRLRRALSEHDATPAQAFVDRGLFSVRDGGGRAHQDVVLRIAWRTHGLLESAD